MRPTPTWSRAVLVVTAVTIGIGATGCSPTDAVSDAISDFKLCDTPEPVARIRVEPSELTVAVGGTAQLNATLIRANGSTIYCAPAVGWASSDTLIARVGGTGTVLARGPGTTYIAALAGGKLDSARVTVTSQ